MAAVQPPAAAIRLAGNGTNRLSDALPEVVSATNNL